MSSVLLTSGSLRFWKLEKLEEDTKLEYHFHLAVHQSGVNCFDIKVQGEAKLLLFAKPMFNRSKLRSLCTCCIWRRWQLSVLLEDIDNRLGTRQHSACTASSCSVSTCFCYPRWVETSNREWLANGCFKGVRIMPNGNIITSAWDQRCTIWKSDGAKIDSVLTQVADCSALDIVQSGKGLRGLLAGTGWQTVDVYWSKATQSTLRFFFPLMSFADR